MPRLLAMGALLLAVPALAQTTPTNPEVLAPPLSPSTPGGSANPSDTGARPLGNDTQSSASQSATSTAGAETQGARHRQHRPR